MSRCLRHNTVHSRVTGAIEMRKATYRVIKIRSHEFSGAGPRGLLTVELVCGPKSRVFMSAIKEILE